MAGKRTGQHLIMPSKLTIRISVHRKNKKERIGRPGAAPTDGIIHRKEIGKSKGELIDSRLTGVLLDSSKTTKIFSKKEATHTEETGGCHHPRLDTNFESAKFCNIVLIFCFGHCSQPNVYATKFSAIVCIFNLFCSHYVNLSIIVAGTAAKKLMVV